MRRRTGWEQRLHALTRARLRTPYRWGVQDCALFAADAVFELTGEDLAAGLRGQYEDEEGAARVLDELGAASIEDLPGRWLAPIPPSMARRGDVASFDGPHGRFLAIVDGRTAVGPGARGLVHVPMGQARAAWRVD